MSQSTATQSNATGAAGAQTSPTTTTIDWAFPLPRTHTGLPVGNGRMGLLVWGGGETLRITIGRADVWDHRGGMPWTERQNYRAIRTCLEAGDEPGIRALFRPETEGVPGQPARPSVLPIGRIDVHLEKSASLIGMHLNPHDAVVDVSYRIGPAVKALSLRLSPDDDVAWVTPSTDIRAVEVIPSYDLMGDRLRGLSFDPPELLGPRVALVSAETGRSSRSAERADRGGWFWSLPNDPGISVGWARFGEAGAPLVIATERAADSGEARRNRDLLAASFDVERATDSHRRWWGSYRAQTPKIRVPNATIQEIYDYGMYLFAGLTNPTGVAATLQGPWIEEYDFPPWSSDYHFNINVQMCYSPALAAGLASHLRPLFDLVWSWRDQLRQNARNFIGVDDGYMLPHAVDDRCTCMGTFWTGTLDHGCTAWVARMMYDYVDYTGDVAFLREVAYPFMRGTFAVYRAMMEADGEALRLPLSVSPEYRGARMDAWGADASFQLAAVHRLCEDLWAAARTLNDPADPEWANVASRLPKATVVNPGRPDERIGLWEGVDLEESHRHHSHLAGITPFDTLDLDDPTWRSRIASSIRHWIAMGMGLWSGWCMSWASQIHSRIGNGDGAELLLELWRRVFANEGRGSMHDAVSNGLTLMGAPAILPDAETPGTDSANASTGSSILEHSERMQMDGAMGSVSAVMDMLLHSRRGVLYPFPAIPADWPDATFEGVHAPKGLIVSGWYRRNSGWRVEVVATRDTDIHLVVPGSAASTVVVPATDPGGPEPVAPRKPAPRVTTEGGRHVAGRLPAGSRLVIEGE